jgi:hypothetical protein
MGGPEAGIRGLCGEKRCFSISEFRCSGVPAEKILAIENTCPFRGGEASFCRFLLAVPMPGGPDIHRLSVVGKNRRWPEPDISNR